MNQKQICLVTVMPEQFLQEKLQRTWLKYVYVVKEGKSVLRLPWIGWTPRKLVYYFHVVGRVF